MIINQEFKNLIPPLSKEEYLLLEQSLKSEGCRDPLVIWNDTLIDGHNRYKICTDNNIEFKTIIKEFKNDDEAKIWIIDNQLARRNLIDIDKFELKSKKKDILLQLGKENMSAGAKATNTGLSTIDKPIHNTQKELAKELGWSTGKVAMAEIVSKNATDQQKELLKSNKITINEAYCNIKRAEYKQKELKKYPEISFTNSYDSNMFHLTNNRSIDGHDWPDCLDTRIPQRNVREYIDYYPTLTCVGRFFHYNGREFSLREYADIQDFPENFKFVGTPQEIKKQIGNAVSPKMSEYVIKKYITGETYLDLFCGSGGFSCGAHKLDKVCKFALDFNRSAIHSFNLNFPDVLVRFADIKDIDIKKIHQLIGEVDFIIGGPPCQGFSRAGKRLGFNEDDRNMLYLNYLKFVNEFKPKQFIMENVPEILEYRHIIIEAFNEIGYSVETELVNGSNIGMIQRRVRAFFIGNKLKGGE